MSFSSAPTRRYFLAGAGGMMLSRSAWAQAPAATVVGLPELPYQKSKLIHGLRWLNEPQHNANAGDTWTCTWADDGNLYSVGDDTSGTGQEGWNLSIYKVEGMPPGHVVTRINDMRGYGHANEGHWWKGAGLAAIDGVLYLGIYSQSVPRVGSATRVSFNADHSSIIKSSDYGKTWSPTATVEKPMFPGKEFPLYSTARITPARSTIMFTLSRTTAVGTTGTGCCWPASRATASSSWTGTIGSSSRAPGSAVNRHGIATEPTPSQSLSIRAIPA